MFIIYKSELNCNELMLHALQGLTPDKGYVWFLLDWLDADWWNVDFYNSNKHAALEAVPCSTAELQSFAEQGFFTLSSPFFGDDGQSVVGGGTVQEWKELYLSTVQKEASLRVISLVRRS